MTKTELLAQFDILRTEYVRLLNDKDVLLNWGKPQLEALYHTKIGEHQVQLLQMQLRIQALKRKLEMVRSAIARNLPINITEIELLVAVELANAELKILEQVTQIENSKYLLTNLESPNKSAELRKLFRQFAKQLHPDVNTDATPEQTHLWHMVKDAYHHGDIEKLRALQLVYEKELKQGEVSMEGLTEAQIMLKNETLKAGIKVFNTEIEALKNAFPFNMEQQLKDDDWVAEQVNHINKQLQQLHLFEGELILEYKQLMNNDGGAK